MEQQRFSGRVALVFGAGSAGPGWGNGKAAAATYGRQGAYVVAVDCDAAALEETVSVLRAEQTEVLPIQADVTDGEQVRRAVKRAVEHWGAIDILHNNVGTTELGDPPETDEATWHRVIDVNLTSVYLTCKHVLPIMVAQKRGAIVNISSRAAISINNYPYFSYNAAKAGLNQMTRALAVRYAPDGIRVNAIMPGVMFTPLVYKQFRSLYGSDEEMIAARSQVSPMGRMGDAWDVANAAAFLASDEARYITGVCLPVDGGASCR